MTRQTRPSSNSKLKISEFFQFLQFKCISSSHIYRYVHGCLQSCSDADACNGVSSTLTSSLFRVWLVTTMVPFILWPWSLRSLRSSLIVLRQLNRLRWLHPLSKSIHNQGRRRFTHVDIVGIDVETDLNVSNDDFIMNKDDQEEWWWWWWWTISEYIR